MMPFNTLSIILCREQLLMPRSLDKRIGGGYNKKNIEELKFKKYFKN